MDLIYFLGRFHVLMLHVPIGVLTLAILLELVSRVRRYGWLEPLIAPVWLAGWLSGVLTVTLGFMHATETGFQDSSAVEFHRWSGVSLTASAFIVWLWRVRLKPLTAGDVPAWASSSHLDKLYAAIQPVWAPGSALDKSYRRLWPVGSIVVFALLFLTGHLGGNLTHGDTYLWQYAPKPIRRLAGISAETDPRPPPKDLASADIYLDIVAPAVHQHCDACHNAGKTSGGLSVANYEALMKGGKAGAVITPGDAAKSDLFRRINLGPSDKDFMPQDGKTPMTADQIAAVGVWISAGAPKSAAVGALKLTPAQKAILQKAMAKPAGDDSDDANAGPASDGPALPVVTAADPAAVKALTDTGFEIRPLARGSQLVVVDFTTHRALTDADFANLARIAPQTRTLNLYDGQVSDAQLKALAPFVNLAQLRLEANPITDAGLAGLAPLKALANLNLVNTKITDAGVAQLSSLAKLQRLYLWGTAVTPPAVAKLKDSRPGLFVYAGLKPTDVAKEQKMLPVN